MKALTVLKKAKALIDAGRWLQSDWHQKSRRINVKTGKRLTKGASVTCYCAGGAIRAAGRQLYKNYNDAENIFLRALGKPIDYPSGIWDWNDDKKRTVGQVRAAFRKAVKIAEKEAA